MLQPSRITPALLLVLGLCLPSTAAAIPLLQIGIAGGWYDTVKEDTVASSASFTMYAYLTPPNNVTSSQLNAYLNDTYYISAAMMPALAASSNLGSFKFNNQTINATADMVYGTPPYEPLDPGTQDADKGDLPGHGVYNTYFKEFSFKFKTGPSSAANVCGSNVQCTSQFNVQDTVGTTPTPTTTGPKMYYMEFQVDTASLNTNYQLQFDLYSETYKNCNSNYSNSGCDIDINKFAPFSHNARSKTLFSSGNSSVPEPSSLALLGAGAAALALRYRRRSR